MMYTCMPVSSGKNDSQLASASKKRKGKFCTSIDSGGNHISERPALRNRSLSLNDHLDIEFVFSIS